MDSKKVIRELFKIAEKQQKIIQKLVEAQVQTEMVLSDPKSSVPAMPPAPTGAPIGAPPKREAETILNALPPTVKPAVANIEVHDNTVSVTFHPGKASQQAYDAVKGLVQQLQAANKLPAQSYNVHVVG
jgi:hypothetical protein